MEGADAALADRIPAHVQAAAKGDGLGGIEDLVQGFFPEPTVGGVEKHGRTAPSASITAETQGALHRGDAGSARPWTAAK